MAGRVECPERAKRVEGHDRDVKRLNVDRVAGFAHRSAKNDDGAVGATRRACPPKRREGDRSETRRRE